jgi:hypothetical protein
MLSRLIPAILLLVFGLPGEARANTVDCGGNSFSFAEVAPPRRTKLRNEPVRVGPDSLCVDLIEDRPQAIESMQFTIDPTAGRQRNPASPGTDRPALPGRDRPAPPGQ